MKAVRNPFYAPFTMERVRSPNEFFKYFSPKVVANVGSKLSQPLSHFVVGPNGCGKTTVLRFLHYRNQQHLSSLSESDSEEARRVLDVLPKNFVGIYYTVHKGPIGDFAGKNVDPEQWAGLYGNYLNFVLSEELVRFLDWCLKNEGWAGPRGIDVKALRNVSDFVGLLAEVAEQCGASAFHDILINRAGSQDANRVDTDYNVEGSLSDACDALVSHLNTYHRLLSTIRPTSKELPQDRIGPGALLGSLAAKLVDEKLVDRETTVFMMMDEYQELSNCDGNELLPRVVNSMVASCSRVQGSTIQYKIGSRRWALKDIQLMQSGTKIERDRDYSVIDLANEMKAFDKEYRPFVEDVSQRLLDAVPEFRGMTLSKIVGTESIHGRYCGFECLARVSYPIVFYHLRLFKNLFDGAMSDLSANNKSISTSHQDYAVRFLSHCLYEEVATERSSRGSELQQMIARVASVLGRCNAVKVTIAPGVYKNAGIAWELFEQAKDHALFLDESSGDRVVLSLCPTLRPHFGLSVEAVRAVDLSEDLVEGLTKEKKVWDELLERKFPVQGVLFDDGATS